MGVGASDEARECSSHLPSHRRNPRIRMAEPVPDCPVLTVATPRPRELPALPNNSHKVMPPDATLTCELTGLIPLVGSLR